MNDANKMTQLETLLRDVQLSDPSMRLDRRMQFVFRGRIRRWVGPLLGFAAGVLATLSASRLMSITPPQAHPSDKAMSMTAPPTERPPAPRMIDVWAEPLRQVQSWDADVKGMPVEVQRVRYQLMVQGAPGTPPTKIDMRQIVTLRPKIQY